MGAYKPPVPVKLVIGLLSGDPAGLRNIRSRLSGRFGPEEEVMDPIPFRWTRYYEDELGPSPWRAFVSYETLVPRESLVDIKRWTNDLELEGSIGGRRVLNLDPGYMTLGQFFLATTKDQRHRVYVRDGIFVEPTLYFEDGDFHPFAWTYRDYRSEEYRKYFLAARAKLAYQMRHEGRPYSTRKGFSGEAGGDGGNGTESPFRDSGKGGSGGGPG